MDLNEIRGKIDSIDDKILDLFIERMNLSLDVAKFKSANNMVVFQGEREKFIIDNVRENAPEPLKKSAAFLFMNIMDISKCAQINEISPDFKINFTDKIKERASVAVQGIEGAYGHAACKKLFDNGSISFFASFKEVFEAVESGDVDYGVLPVENSTAGEVTANMELLERHSVYICRTVFVECAHVLAAKKGVREEDVKILFGHEQAIRQCTSYIEGRGDLTVIPYHNNAAAAKMVSENESGELGCICSAECAEMHGLEIVRDSIASDPDNRTRFICISKNVEVYGDADTVAVSLSIPNISGALYRLLTKFAVNGLSMSKILSKPLPTEVKMKFPEDYMFYIEFDGSVKDPVVRRLLGNFESELNYFKFHGNFAGSRG